MQYIVAPMDIRANARAATSIIISHHLVAFISGRLVDDAMI